MNENTSLATFTEEQALAKLDALDLTPGGMEHVDRNTDVARAPRIRISAQNKPLIIAEKEIPVGNIANTMTGQDYGNAVAAVFLRFMSDTRVAWPAQYNADNDPLCASDDGVMPSVATAQRPLTARQDGPCASCPMAEFLNGEAPRCSRQRNFLIWLTETEEPVLLTIQSSGLKPGKTLTNLAIQCKVKRAIWFTTVKTSNDKGTWFTFAYTNGDKIKPSLSLALHELKQDLATLEIFADTDMGNDVPQSAPPVQQPTGPTPF